MNLSRATIFRIISFSLVAGDVFQTIPATLELYMKNWNKGRLSATCTFYAITRYVSIISLVANGYAAFSTSFTPESCKRYYMLPNVTALVAGMAIQVLVYIRTLAISGHSRYVRYGLGLFMLLGFPVQIFGIVYHRDPSFKNGTCKGRVLHPGEPDWNIVYYSAHMAFDLVAVLTATTYLVFISFSSYRGGIVRLSKLVRMILRDGLVYFVVVFAANLWVVMEFAHVFVTGAASTLPLAVELIAAQHLILSTRRLAERDPTIASLSQTISAGPPRFRTPTQHELESQIELGKFDSPGRDKRAPLTPSEYGTTEAGASTLDAQKQMPV